MRRRGSRATKRSRIQSENGKRGETWRGGGNLSDWRNRSGHTSGERRMHPARTAASCDPRETELGSTSQTGTHGFGPGTKPAGPGVGQHGCGGGARLRVSQHELLRQPQPDSGSSRVTATRARKRRLMVMGVAPSVLRAVLGERGRSSREPRSPPACGRHTRHSNVGPACACAGGDLSETGAFSATGGRLCGSRGASRFAKREKTSRLCGLCGRISSRKS
jgi:hypothetical protein